MPFHTGSDTVNEQFYGKDGEVIYSLSRGLLNKKMVDLAEKRRCGIFLRRESLGCRFNNCPISIGNRKEVMDYSRIRFNFGADGAFSRIRHKMQTSQVCLIILKNFNIGYKELTFQPTQMELIIR